MKRLATTLALVALGLCLAQTTGTLTVTIPSDVATALAHAHAAQYAEIRTRAGKTLQTVDEASAPSTVQGMLGAEIATIIAIKVQRYSPRDLPSKQPGESDSSQYNRYQSSVRSQITVK